MVTDEEWLAQEQRFYSCGNCGKSFEDEPGKFVRPDMPEFVEAECPECRKTPIEHRFEALGFSRVGTGGGCEAAESAVVGGLYVCVTDGDAGYPVEGGDVWVGLMSQEHGDPLWERTAAASQVDEAVKEALVLRERAVKGEWGKGGVR